MTLESLLVLKSGIAHVTNGRFDLLDLVQFHVAVVIFEKRETLGAFSAGKFLFAVFMPDDHVDGEVVRFLELFGAEGTIIRRDARVGVPQVRPHGEFAVKGGRTC